MQFDTLLVDTEDWEHLGRIYEDRLPQILQQNMIRNVYVSLRLTAGTRIYLKAGEVGTLAWELPLGDPELTREGTRKTDVYTLEGVPVFVANGADAIRQVRKT